MAKLSKFLLLFLSSFLHSHASPVQSERPTSDYTTEIIRTGTRYNSKSGSHSVVPYQMTTNVSVASFSTTTTRVILGSGGSSSVPGTTTAIKNSTTSLGTPPSTPKSVPLGTGTSVRSRGSTRSSSSRRVSSSSDPTRSSTSTTLGSGLLPFSTSTDISSTSGSSTLPFTFSGSWSASPTVPSQTAFPFFLVPTATTSDSAATSEAALLGPLYFALQADRHQVTDPKLKSEYVDNLKKTKAETNALFNYLKVQPPADPQCSNTKIKRSVVSEKRLRSLISKRSLISGLTDLVGNAAKLLSCASHVVDNLVDAVNAPAPDLSEIELLTDTLAEIAKDLQEEDQKKSKSASQSTASKSSASSAASLITSSTGKSRSTSHSITASHSIASSTASSTGHSSSKTFSSASCTGSRAVPSCTETISFSTSYLSGATSNSIVATITTTACTTATITECGVAGSTITATATSTSNEFICGIDCSACVDSSPPSGIPKSSGTGSPLPIITERSGEQYERTLEEPAKWKNGVDVLVMEGIEDSSPAAKILIHNQYGTHSSALSAEWLNEPQALYVAGLFGCTAIVVISEAGVWFSHHFEAPSFFGTDEVFQTQVLDSIKNGDKVKEFGGTTYEMPALFPLTKSGQPLAPGTDPKIFISTPLNSDSDSGELLYKERVEQVVSFLTASGAPLDGVPVTTRGYVKPTGDEVKKEVFAKRARTKVLIQYDNKQEDDPDSPPAKQRAIWRVYMENQGYQHEWDATDAQKSSCSTKQKRQNGGSCSISSSSKKTSSTSISSSSTAPHTTTTALPSTTTAAPPPPAATTAAGTLACDRCINSIKTCNCSGKDAVNFCKSDSDCTICANFAEFNCDIYNA